MSNGIGSLARFGETFWRISIVVRVMRVVSAMSAVSPLPLLTDFVATSRLLKNSAAFAIVA